MDGNDVTLIAAIVGFFASLIGGWLSGHFTIKAADKSHKHALELAEQEQRQDVKNFLQSIYDEMDNRVLPQPVAMLTSIFRRPSVISSESLLMHAFW